MTVLQRILWPELRLSVSDMAVARRDVALLMSLLSISAFFEVSAGDGYAAEVIPLPD